MIIIATAASRSVNPRCRSAAHRHRERARGITHKQRFINRDLSVWFNTYVNATCPRDQCRVVRQGEHPGGIGRIEPEPLACGIDGDAYQRCPLDRRASSMPDESVDCLGCTRVGRTTIERPEAWRDETGHDPEQRDDDDELDDRHSIPSTATSHRNALAFTP